MLLNANEQFVICTTKEVPGKGYSVLHGPASSPQELGIPDALIAEGEAKMMDDLFVSLKAGKHVSVSLNGNYDLSHHADTKPQSCDLQRCLAGFLQR